jgi:hypothetical protein
MSAQQWCKRHAIASTISAAAAAGALGTGVVVACYLQLVPAELHRKAQLTVQMGVLGCSTVSPNPSTTAVRSCAIARPSAWIHWIGRGLFSGKHRRAFSVIVTIALAMLNISSTSGAWPLIALFCSPSKEVWVEGNVYMRYDGGVIKVAVAILKALGA